jgi:lactam utilization protein B
MQNQEQFKVIWAAMAAQTVAFECLLTAKPILIEHLKMHNNYDQKNRTERNKLDKEMKEVEKRIIAFISSAKRLTKSFGAEDGEYRKQTDELADKIYQAVGL